MSQTLGLEEGEFRAAIDLAGEKLRDLLAADRVGIALLDRAHGALHAPYLFELGRRSTVAPWIAFGTGARVMRTHETLSFATRAGATICAPLLAGTDSIGFIAVGKMSTAGFRPSDPDLVTTIAESLSIALEKARLVERTRRLLEESERRNAELALITGIQEGLVANLDLDAIVELVGEKLRETFGGVAIAWFDDQSMQVRPIYVCENGIRLPHIAPFTARPTEANVRMLHERTSVVVNRVDPASETAAPGTRLPRAYMRAPVLAGERVIGVINIDNFERTDAFGDADVRLLRTVAIAMGVALQSSHLLNETRRLLTETGRRSSELVLINEIQQILMKELDFEAITRVVGDKLREGLGLPDLSVWWWEEQAEQVRLAYSFNYGRTNPTGHVYPMSALGPPGRLVLVERTPFVAGNWAQQEALGLTCIPGTKRSLTVASAPIVSSRGVLGMLIVEDPCREHALDESSLRLMEIVGAAMGAALENARLRDQARLHMVEPG